MNFLTSVFVTLSKYVSASILRNYACVLTRFTQIRSNVLNEKKKYSDDFFRKSYNVRIKVVEKFDLAEKLDDLFDCNSVFRQPNYFIQDVVLTLSENKIFCFSFISLVLQKNVSFRNM